MHTPLPWKLVTLDLSDEESVFLPVGLVSAVTGATVVAYNGGFAPDNRCWNGEEIKGNADLVLRAVNSHEALLEACKAALDVLLFTADRETQLQVADQLSAAIAKAEGQEVPNANR